MGESKTPILDRLDDERVLTVTEGDDGKLYFWEACDGYFNCGLTKDETLQLIEELKYLVGQLGK